MSETAAQLPDEELLADVEEAMRDAIDDALLNEIAPAIAGLGDEPRPGEALPLLVGVRFRRDECELNLFTTIATLGTPMDITLQEIRVETLFPADENSKIVLATRH